MASAAGSGGGAGAGAGGLKTYFKTPEGRHKLQYEKTHSPAVVHYSHSGKTVSQMTVAYLKEKPAGQGSTPSTPSAGSGMRSAAARLLGTGNGSRALGFGSNGTSRAVSGNSRMGGGIGVSTSASGSQGMANYDGKGMYIIFNTADTLFISDLNSHDKDPIKSIHFSGSNPLCHAFDPEAKDGHDLLIGVFSGDVYSMSLRQQLQDPGKKPVSYQHFVNKDKDKDKDPSQGGAASSCPDLPPKKTCGIAFVERTCLGSSIIQRSGCDARGAAQAPGNPPPLHPHLELQQSPTSAPSSRTGRCFQRGWTKSRHETTQEKAPQKEKSVAGKKRTTQVNKKATSVKKKAAEKEADKNTSSPAMGTRSKVQSSPSSPAMGTRSKRQLLI